MASLTRKIRKSLCAAEARELKIDTYKVWLLSYSQSAFARRVCRRAKKAQEAALAAQK